MKRLIVNLVALLVIGMGGFYMTVSANTAASNANIQSGPTCPEMGCTGGDLDCYSPKEGGMCYTSDEDPEVKN